MKSAGTAVEDGGAQAADARLRNLGAIGAMVLSTVLYTLSDTAMKLASETVPTGQAIVMRSAGSVAILLAAAVASGVAGQIREAFNRIMLWRTLGDAGNSLCFQAALARMPLADTMGILQLSPLSLTAASALFLGAHVGWRRWSAVLVGFIGALLVIKPGTSAFNIYALLVVLSVLCGSLRDLSTRKLDPALSPLVILLISQVGVGVVALGTAAFSPWHWPTLGAYVHLGIAAAFIAAGHIAGIAAIRHSDLAVVAPFRYAGILWAVLSGYLVWGHVPDFSASIGILVLVLAGLYTLRRERHLRNS